MTTSIDPAIVLSATRDAGAALDSAMSIAQQKQTDLLNKLSAAKTALDAAEVAFGELEVEAGKGSPNVQALQAKIAQATTNSVAALKSSSELIGAVGFVGTIGSPIDEWKECRTTIDRFDKILVDLRKTGFGFVTAIAAGAQFVFADNNNFDPKAALLAMLVILIVTLYWIDLAHQTWLDVTVERAKEIENDVFNRTISLTNKIGEKFLPARAIILGFFLYVFLLAATCMVFFFSVPRAEAYTSGHHGSVGIAFGCGLTAIVGGWIFSDPKRKNWSFLGIEAQHGFVFWVGAIALIGIVGHSFMKWF
jgi:hypothetical protein